MSAEMLAHLRGEVTRLRQELAAAEQKVRDVERRLHKRVHSCLSSIGTVARRSADPGSEQYVTHLEGRIGALARAHTTAMRDPCGNVELHHLIAEELLAHAAIEGPQLTVSGPELWLCGRAVDAFWLAIHELTVNAVKYGALSSGGGHIVIAWAVHWQPPPSLRLRWSERGGPPMAGSRRSGFGTEVIERMLSRGLGGEGVLAFTPGGLDCVITVPTSGDVCPDRPAVPR